MQFKTFYWLSHNGICNGNRTEWSPIRSVIIRVITKSDDREVELSDNKLSDNKLSDKKLSDNKLSDNNLTSELVGNMSFLNQSQFISIYQCQLLDVF